MIIKSFVILTNPKQHNLKPRYQYLVLLQQCTLGEIVFFFFFASAKRHPSQAKKFGRQPILLT